MSNSDFPRLRYSDVEEILVLDHTVSTFSGAGTPEGAEVDAAALTSALSVQGCLQVDIITYITDVNTDTKLFIKVRFSGQKSPDTGSILDWGYVQTDNIDPATGISTVQEYMIQIDLTNTNGIPVIRTTRKYLSRIQQISGRMVSAVVWTDNGTALGTVSFLRQGGSM